MNPSLFSKNPNHLFLFLILILAAVLRFYGLTNQSMWVDELHTMVESDPTITWGMMFDYLKCCDPHPPLYFIIERILFVLIGHTDWVARSLSASCGVASVYAMYLLGKEIRDQELGLIAALLTSINFFNRQYSQEARCYIMAFLFAVISFLFFIKLLKTLGTKQMYYYILFTLLLLYSHYYSLFLVAGQGLVAFILWLAEKENKRRFFKIFATAGMLMLVGYLPWLPFFLQLSKVKSSWIGTISPDFAITYFFDYFGSYVLLKPFLVLLLAYFFWQVMKQEDLSWDRIKESPLQLAFLVFSVVVAVTYLIPYLRSLFVVPMLLNRYTIIVVPAFIIAISFSFALISNRIAQMLLITAFVGLTLMDLIVLKRYYNTNNFYKTQFRELTEFISQNPARMYPIVEEKTSWQHSYYLKKYNYTAPVFPGKKEVTVDSILRGKSPKYDLEAFWIVSAANGFEPHLDPSVRARLDSSYTLASEKEFYDACAQLFVKSNDRLKNITNYFPPKSRVDNEEVIPIWGGAIESRAIPLKPGNYRITFIMKGTKAGGVFPHINVELNAKKIGEITATPHFREYTFPFIQTAGQLTVSLDFDNDAIIGRQNRSVFITIVTLEEE
jgi:mannosyltransferase